MKFKKFNTSITVIAFLVVFSIFAIMVYQQIPEDSSIGDGAPSPDQPTSQPIDPTDDCDSKRGKLTKESCEEAGGTWNQCGSACRDLGPDEACIEVCVEMCECESDAQCPDEYSCEEFVDGTGICKSK